MAIRMAIGNKFQKPPANELTNKPVRRVARAAAPRKLARAAAPRKSVLIINDDNSGDNQSVHIFISAFTDSALDYDVTLEKSEETSCATWKDYDLVVWSCSDDYSAVSDDYYRYALIEYVGSGGNLILEGGNIAAWNHLAGGTTLTDRFREQVIYAPDEWVFQDVGDLELRTADHPIATTPNPLPETISFTTPDSSDRDKSGYANAVRILSGAIGIFGWSYVAHGGNHVNPTIEKSSYGLIAHDANGEKGGRIVYYAFDLEYIDSDIQQKLIQNSVNWL